MTPALTTIYTIGHSNHSQEVFNTALIRNGITHLIDVRSSPYSRFAPHFNREHIRKVCQASSVFYTHAPQLGGLGNPTHATADLLIRLVKNVERNPSWKVCLMCSEGDPADCHRHYWLGQLLVRQRLCTVVHLHATKVLPATLSGEFSVKHRAQYIKVALDALFHEAVAERMRRGKA